MCSVSDRPSVATLFCPRALVRREKFEKERNFHITKYSPDVVCCVYLGDHVDRAEERCLPRFEIEYLNFILIHSSI